MVEVEALSKEPNDSMMTVIFIIAEYSPKICRRH
jgi:hypothetical protein